MLGLQGEGGGGGGAGVRREVEEVVRAVIFRFFPITYSISFALLFTANGLDGPNLHRIISAH
jgi:hypothetical protein